MFSEGHCILFGMTDNKNKQIYSIVVYQTSLYYMPFLEVP